VSYQYPDRISVEVTEELAVNPRHAVLDIVVEGESSFFGDAAFKKSKEIAKLVEELKSVEYDENNIRLESISIQTNSGKVLKSSSARFNLKLDKIGLDVIPKLLSICANQKNIEVKDMEYYFGNLEKEKAKLLQLACSNSKQQGELIAKEFCVDMRSIYSMAQKWNHPIEHGLSRSHLGGMKMSKSRGMAEPELSGLDYISNFESKLQLTLKVEFRVGEFK